MTNEEMLEDLKQFVRGAVSGLATQADLESLRAEMVTKADLESKVDELVEGMNQQTETIVDAVEKLDHRHAARLDDHESRISTLERHAAA